jgi:hypothetical protein
VKLTFFTTAIWLCVLCPDTAVAQRGDSLASDLPISARMLSGVIPLDAPRAFSFLITNVGPDTLYYDPCGGGVFLDELDPEVPRAFAVSNMDACTQRDPLAPGETVEVPTSISFKVERMLEAGLAPRYRLRLVDYIYRRLPPSERAGLRPFDEYVRISGVILSEPFRFYQPSR